MPTGVGALAEYTVANAKLLVSQDNSWLSVIANLPHSVAS